MIKLLIPSGLPWNTSNSFGNSYANIFDGIDNIELHNVFFANGSVNDPHVTSAYKITLKQNQREEIISSKQYREGHDNDNKEQLNSFFRNHKWMIFYWLRTLLWDFNHWDTSNFEEYLSNISPDIIFVPLSQSTFINKIVIKIIKKLNVPVITYISDDNYTLKHFSLSPFYWLTRLYSRRYVKQIILQSKTVYVISEIQKREYDSIFHCNCKILTKGAKFDNIPQYAPSKRPYHLMYAGNIGIDRWQSLHTIAEAIKDVNDENGTKKFYLSIYTAHPLNKRKYKALNIKDASKTFPGISYAEVIKKQKNADILVHAEATSIRYRNEAHQGFSTKLVDYMELAKPIIAFGCSDQASIAHLRENDAALIAYNKRDIIKILHQILENPDILERYGRKAFDCGKRNHQIDTIQKDLRTEIQKIYSLRDSK